jgi:hypothetical protein
MKKLKEDEMDGACSTHGNSFLVKKPKKIAHLEGLADKIIILKWILLK